MKLETKYKLSLFLPLIALVLLLFFSINIPDNRYHPSYKILLLKGSAIEGMILYVPFVVFMALKWRIKKYDDKELPRHIKSIPLVYCAYSIVAVPAWLL